MRKMLTGLLCAVVAATAEAVSLPFGYEAVEYIESTKGGGQYINTGYIHKENTKIACEVGAAESQQSGTGWAAAFGACHYGWDASNAFVFFIKDNNNFVRYNRTKREDAGGKFVFPRNVRTTITCEGRTAKWSTAGNSRSITLDDGAIVDKGECPMLIFEKNRSDNGGVDLDNSRAVMKLYSFKIYEGDDTRPVRDFVPCLERATGKAGLYETVEGKFYGNAGNGGDFLTAQPSGYRPVEYIESTPGGGQYIDTGYVAKPTTRFEIGSEPMIKSIPDFSKFLQGEVVKVRWLKIYEGDVLVRDFVPCVEAATGEAGLRDRIGGAFYRNEGAYCFNTPMSFGHVLTSGTYAFEESIMYAAPATESALKIAENSRVTLRIPAGVTVTLFGGNAQGKSGAGAGIEVPPTSSLSVVGDGKGIFM